MREPPPNQQNRVAQHATVAQKLFLSCMGKSVAACSAVKRFQNGSQCANRRQINKTGLHKIKRKV
jgi:hypothetical protein